MEAFRWIGHGFSLFASAPGSWALLTLVGGVLYVLPFAIPLYGILLGSWALPGLYAALFLAADAADHREPITLGLLVDAWDWRRARTLIRVGGLALAANAFQVLLQLHAADVDPTGRMAGMDWENLVILVAIDLVLSVYFMLTVALITLTNASAAEALTDAGTAIFARPLHISLLVLVVSIVTLLGAASIVGLLIALPVTFATVYYAARDLYGLEGSD